MVALHPCYADTLCGFVFVEIDTALKAVGGTAKGGLFLDAGERAAFLATECQVHAAAQLYSRNYANFCVVRAKNVFKVTPFFLRWQGVTIFGGSFF